MDQGAPLHGSPAPKVNRWGCDGAAEELRRTRSRTGNEPQKAHGTRSRTQNQPQATRRTRNRTGNEPQKAHGTRSRTENQPQKTRRNPKPH
ncbi:hypothetical protein RKD18_004081 [Streptomyces phaeoluteigriseus]